MPGGIRLHLGCGDVFRPGYLNVDRYNLRAADVIGDVISLPFSTGCADRIEAFHVIEHFDLIHCKYILSEWLRVLRPDGVLVVETPDLAETCRGFARSNPAVQRNRLSWVYGIDSPGMSHKIGFSFKLAKDLLKECGFEDVRRCDPSTHLYEAGMRIECRRPDRCWNTDFAVSFRRNLLAGMGTSDSYVLVPLEKYVKNVLSKTDDYMQLTKERLMAIVADMLPVNPSIALAVIEAWRETTGQEAGAVDSLLTTVQDLRDKGIHHKALTLWLRTSKSGNVEAQFGSMMDRLGKDMLRLMNGDSSASDDFSYLFGLEPRETPLMDLEIVLMDARARMYAGVKKFASGNLDSAMEILDMAAMENPGDPYVHWNIARLGALKGMNRRLVERHYETAISLPLIPEREESLREELDSYRRAGPTAIPREPIAEY